MADGVQITAGSGTTVATDDAGAAGHVQIVKLAQSADGSATPMDSTNGALHVTNRESTPSFQTGSHSSTTTVTIPMNGAHGLLIHVYGTWAGSFTFQSQIDSTTRFIRHYDVNNKRWRENESYSANQSGFFYIPGVFAPLQVNINVTLTSGTMTYSAHRVMGAPWAPLPTMAVNTANGVMVETGIDVTSTGLYNVLRVPGSTSNIPADATNGLSVDVKRIAAGTNYIGRVRLTDGTTDISTVNSDGNGLSTFSTVPTTSFNKLANGTGASPSWYHALSHIGAGETFSVTTDARNYGIQAVFPYMWDGATAFRLRGSTTGLYADVRNIKAKSASGTITGAGQLVQIADIGLATYIRVRIVGTFTAVLAFEGEAHDGTGSWQPLTAYGAMNNVTNATGGGTFYIPTSGMVNFRVNCISYTSGSASVNVSTGYGLFPQQYTNSGREEVGLAAGTNNIGDVDVLTLPSLPAGTNNIGDVDVLTLPSLPAGNNNIGDVDVLTLPALPAGNNNIGDVDVLTLPPLPAGTNNIGDVDVLTLPSLPAGTNNIGDVDVLTLPPLPAGENNIGDVDVLTLPSIPAGTNYIGKVRLTDGTTDIGSSNPLHVRVESGPNWIAPTTAPTLPASYPAVQSVTTFKHDSSALGFSWLTGIVEPAVHGSGAAVNELKQRLLVDTSLRLHDSSESAGNQLVIAPGTMAHGLDVDVTRLPALPAGSNLVGKVELSGGGNTVGVDANGNAKTRIGDGAGNDLNLAAEGAASPTRGIVMYGWDGVNAYKPYIGSDGAQKIFIPSSYVVTTAPEKTSTATLTNVATSTASAQLLAANTSRRGVIIHNDSSGILYVKYGTTASATSFTYRLTSQATLELPTSPMYTGRIDGILDTGTGTARVTELT